jgi:hypothetical protein
MNSAISSEVFGDAPRLCEAPGPAGAAAAWCRHRSGKESGKAQASRVTSTVTSIATLGAPW